MQIITDILTRDNLRGIPVLKKKFKIKLVFNLLKIYKKNFIHFVSKIKRENFKFN